MSSQIPSAVGAEPQPSSSLARPAELHDRAHAQELVIREQRRLARHMHAIAAGLWITSRTARQAATTPERGER